jgi:hypothetical protein
VYQLNRLWSLFQVAPFSPDSSDTVERKVMPKKDARTARKQHSRVFQKMWYADREVQREPDA